MNKKIISVLLFLYIPLLYAQQAPTQNKPPVKPGKIIAELTSSTLTGAGLALATVFIYAGLNKNSNGWDQLAGALLVGGIAYPIGCTAGAYYVGNTGNEKGSFWATLGGSAAGVAVTVSLVALTDISELGVLYFILPPVGAVMGHNLTRRWASPPGNALLNFREGQMSAGIPTLQLRPTDRKENFNKQFRILSIQF